MEGATETGCAGEFDLQPGSFFQRLLKSAGSRDHFTGVRRQAGELA